MPIKVAKDTAWMSSIEHQLAAEAMNVQNLRHEILLKRSVAVFTRIGEVILLTSNAAGRGKRKYYL